MKMQMNTIIILNKACYCVKMIFSILYIHIIFNFYKDKEVVLQYKNNSDDIINSIRQKNTILKERYN